MVHHAARDQYGTESCRFGGRRGAESDRWHVQGCVGGGVKRSYRCRCRHSHRPCRWCPARERQEHHAVCQFRTRAARATRPEESHQGASGRGARRARSCNGRGPSAIQRHDSGRRRAVMVGSRVTDAGCRRDRDEGNDCSGCAFVGPRAACRARPHRYSTCGCDNRTRIRNAGDRG